MFVRSDFMFGRGYSPCIYTNIFNLNFFPDYVSQNEFTQHKISQKQVKEFHSDPWWWGPCAPPCGPTPPPWAPHCCLLLPDLATSHLLLLLDCLCAPPPTALARIRPGRPDTDLVCSVQGPLLSCTIDLPIVWCTK